MKNWIYSKGNSAVRCLNKGSMDVVMYVNDVNPDVIAEVVRLYNAGNTLDDIKNYLADEDNCNTDEYEFITEEISNYLKLTKVETQTEMENQNQNVPFPDNLEQVKPSNIILGTESAPIPVEQPVAEGAKEEKQKRQWTRRVTDGKSSFKAQSTEDFIKVMQEKIEMARMLDAVDLPEIPSSMTKGNRDIMVEFQKEHAAMVTKYMQKIQQA